MGDLSGASHLEDNITNSHLPAYFDNYVFGPCASRLFSMLNTNVIASRVKLK